MRGYLLAAHLCLALPARAIPAEPGALSAAEAVRRALERSPAVRAATARLEAATAGLRGARAPFSLQAELAPGAGFTNANAALSQRLDIGGRRSALARVAAGERAAAEAALQVARLQVAAEARAAYYDLVRARAIEAAAAEAADLTRQIRDAVRRRVEIGEAPAVQATRAEIEMARAEQELTRARADVRTRRAVLGLLLGRPEDAPLFPSDPLTAPAAPPPPSSLLEQALRRRPELAARRGLVEAQRGAVDVARSQRRPDLFAELASDVWSLNRTSSETGTAGLLGFQVRLGFPLFDRGARRAEEQRARASVREQEAEMELARRSVAVEVERAAVGLSAARDVALNYEQMILPRTQELLRATRSGFETGLTSFLEVLEAQRVARQTQTEYLNALYDAVRARTDLDRALGAIPGLDPLPGALSFPDSR